MSPLRADAKVVIVDDHPIVRQGLVQLLSCEPGFTVCAEAADAPTALSAIAETKPDIGIVDITLRGTNGIELIENIIAQWPKFPILVLSMHDESLYAQRALRAGAKGYMMKQEAPDTLTKALRRILEGQIYVSENLADNMMRRAIDGKALQDNFPEGRLSDRELEVLQLIGQGHGTRQIAEELNLSVKTIESHRAHIKEKLNLKTAPEMARFAVQWVSQGVL